MQSARWSAALRLYWQKAVENNYSKVSAIFMPDVNEEETLDGGKEPEDFAAYGRDC